MKRAFWLLAALLMVITIVSAAGEIRIDGKIPHKAFEKVVFYPTGGWAKGSNDWINLTITDEKGAPVPVNLAQGEHIVRRLNINGRISFDCFGFLGKDVDPSVLGKQILNWEEIKAKAVAPKA